MTLIRKGQKVKLTPKRDAAFTGEVVGILKDDYNDGPGHFSVFELKDTLTSFNGNAWNVEVVSELPTEPGVYISTAYAHNATMAKIFKFYGGLWHDADGFELDSLSSLLYINSLHGLTRLVPEA